MTTRIARRFLPVAEEGMATVVKEMWSPDPIRNKNIRFTFDFAIPI